MKKISSLVVVSMITITCLAQPVAHAKITILSTMLADTKGKGEWGFAALIETDSTRILFDTGKYDDVVFQNAKELGVDLSRIPALILSHNHLDHTGGAMTLRTNYKTSGSFSTVYVGQGFFNRKFVGQDPMKAFDSAAYVQSGGTIKLVGAFQKIAPGIYLTGPVPRKYPEENYPKTVFIRNKGRLIVDTLPEDMSLAIDTPQGIILLSGCGHAGIVNTLDYTRQQFPNRKIIAAIGGFHLLETNEKNLAWTAEHMKKAGVEYFIGAHCTGINAVYTIRQLTGLPADKCLVATVGTTFSTEKGIVLGWLK